jgi:hypothetical protein
VNAPQLARLLYAASILDLDAFRQKIFPAWKLDWARIRSSPSEATCNVYNFSKHELRPIHAADMTEDFLQLDFRSECAGHQATIVAMAARTCHGNKFYTYRQ